MTDEAKEARRAYERKWRKENKERINAYQKKWRGENSDKVKQYHENYWEKKVSQMNNEEE